MTEWNIQRAGRAWVGEEARQRHELAPNKVETEFIGGSRSI